MSDKPSHPPADQTFPPKIRIRKQADFDHVYQSEIFAADQVLVVRGVQTELDCCRLGLSVSRKVGNAVVRNRWKRMIREAFRKNKAKMPVGVDIVVRPRKGATCNQEAIARSLPKLAKLIQKRLKQQSDKNQNDQATGRQQKK